MQASFLYVIDFKSALKIATIILNLCNIFNKIINVPCFC